MRLIVYISLAYFLSSCSSIPAPSILSPSKSDRLVNVNYGSSPSNYQKILKDYLIRNLTNPEDAKVEFINEPAKLSIDHLGESYSGYRVCLSINEKRGDYFLGYRNHFFLINNNKRNLSTIFSRCVNYKVSLTNNECLKIASDLLGKNLSQEMNNNPVSYTHLTLPTKA